MPVDLLVTTHKQGGVEQERGEKKWNSPVQQRHLAAIPGNDFEGDAVKKTDCVLFVAAQFRQHNMDYLGAQ